MTTYLDLPCMKSSEFVNGWDFTPDDIPEKFRNIKINGNNDDLRIIISSPDDFINTVNCLSFHCVKYLPYELYDYVSENRIVCNTLINSFNCELYSREFTVLITTRKEHLIKRCAKYGLFSLLQYALHNLSALFIPDKACNYAVGDTADHFKCFTYLYETYYDAKPRIINKFTISHKMARKNVPICYLEYLHKKCCYLEKSCGVLYCKHTPWYTDCAEAIVKNNDLTKLRYLYDMNFEFDRHTALMAIHRCKVDILKFCVSKGLFEPEKKHCYFSDIIYKKVSEEHALSMLKYLIELGFVPVSQFPVIGNPARHNYVSCVKFLLENGAQVRPYDMNSAVASGNLELVNMMHANTENMSKEKSIVCDAAARGYYDILLFLIENGYSIDTKNTAAIAKEKGHDKCYELLLKNGCDPFDPCKRLFWCNEWDDPDCQGW